MSTQRALSLVIALMLLGVLPACATVTTGITQPIYVETPEATGASCKLVNRKKNRWIIPETPNHTYVNRGNGPLTVTCKKKGYKTTSVVVDESLQTMAAGNVIAGGFVGFGVDALSGAVKRYPKTVYVWLEPEGYTEEERKDWLARKEAFEENRKRQIREAAEKLYPHHRKRN